MNQNSNNLNGMDSVQVVVPTKRRWGRFKASANDAGSVQAVVPTPLPGK
jgi:hypothetical protein